MTSSHKKTATPSRLPCPLASSLDILGDKWSLLVIRDLFFEKHTFSEFQNSPEKIPSNILAERLKRLEAAEIIEKTAYQQRPIRYSYHLTKKGRDLSVVMKALVDWGNKYIPGTYSFDDVLEMINISKQKKREQANQSKE